MTPSRLLFLSPCFLSPHHGGVQRSGQLAWEALHQSGCTTLVSYGTRCRPSCRHSRLRALLAASYHGFSTDHAIVWHLGLAPLLLCAPRLSSVSVFLHGIECWRPLDRLTRFALRPTTTFWTNSAYTWNRFCEHNPEFRPHPHRVIALGEASPAPFTPAALQPRAVIIGRMDSDEDYKGHRELIHAWPYVLRLIPGAELHIIGDGSGRPALTTLTASLGIAHAVHFHGILSEADKQRILIDSRCLLMPSRGEGFGLVYLEAMRLGRPCLVSSFDAGQEVVQPPEAGLMVDPHNQEQLVVAIARLLTDDRQWDDWSQSARQRYERNYTAQHFQSRILRAHADMLPRQ